MIYFVNFIIFVENLLKQANFSFKYKQISKIIANNTTTKTDFARCLIYGGVKIVTLIP